MRIRIRRIFKFRHGYENVGDEKCRGDENVGDEKCRGDENVGDENVGDENVGDENVGDENVGDEKSARRPTLRPKRSFLILSNKCCLE